MKKNLLILTMVTLSFPVIAPVQAGTIEHACMNGGRKAANHMLCGCIQAAADLTLSRSEQRRAARFFKDPHKAQQTRQSSRTSDERFWRSYKAFGRTAEIHCGS